MSGLGFIFYLVLFKESFKGSSIKELFAVSFLYEGKVICFSYLCEGNAIVSPCEGKAIGGSYLCEGNAVGCSSVSVHLLFYFYQSHVLRAVPSPSLNLAC